MTKRERRTVRSAIRMLYKDDGFERAVGKLCKLIGEPDPYEKLGNLKTMPIHEIMKGCE